MELRHRLLTLTIVGLLVAVDHSSAEVQGPYRVQSFNFPSSKFGITNIIDEAPVAIMEGGRRFFIHQPGLTGANDTVSFEAADWPGHYLRHRDTYLYINLKGPDGFNESATFKMHTNVMNNGYHSFEAADQAGFYIRHSYNKLRLQQTDNSNLFKADASFRFQEGPYLMQAENMKDYVLGVKEGIDAHMVNDNGTLLNFIRPSLTGQADTVSFESHNKPGLYLRHFSFNVDLENRTNPRTPSRFDADCTYKMCKTDCFLPGYVTFQTVNLDFPPKFLRHSYYRLSVADNDNSELFKHDASFKFINSPSYMEPYDLPGYKIDTSPPPNVLVTKSGQELLLVYPGLTNQPGTVSIEVVQDRGKYLRVGTDQKVAVSNGSGEIQETFKQQATFFLRDSPWIADTLVFESVTTPASYITRVDLNFKLQQFQDINSFKASASFVRGSRPLLGTLTSVGPFRVQSLNYPKMRFGITNIIDEAPVAIMEGGRRFFIHQPGLTGDNDTVSFEAADWPGHYLRHRDTYLYINIKGPDGFNESATFKKHTDLVNKGYYSFEAVNQPGFYIRHSYYKLRLQQSDNSNLFKADASFRFLEGPYLMQAENMKEYVIGARGIEAYMVNERGLSLNLAHPGLSGEADTVSMESDEEPGAYIRHYEFRVDFENRTNARYADNFDTDSTFKLCKIDCFVSGYVNFEAVNWPGKFLRHSNSRVIMSDNDNSYVFKHDSSFKYINTASYLEPYSSPGYRIDTGTSDNVLASEAGLELLLVYPGLTNQPGTVSIEMVEYRGKYLRVGMDQNLAVSDGMGEDTDTFRQQATFYLRDSPWIANTLVFESVSTSGSYIARVDFNFKLQPFQDTTSFKSSSSFVRSSRPPLGNVTALDPSLIQSYNYPHDHTFGFSFGDSNMYLVTNGRRFIIRSPGLTGQDNSISFLSSDRPNTYLRKSGEYLVTASRFNPENPLTYLQEATFIVHKDEWFTGYMGFESAAVAGAYIRHDGYRLFVSQNDNSDIFKADASFRRIEGPYLLQSLNYPQNKLGLSQANEAAMTHNGHPWYFVHPGLSNDNGSISLQSKLQGNFYLRHYNYLLDLEDKDNPRNPGIFKYDASFYMRREMFYNDYFALEPVNQENHFVRHSNDRVMTSISDNSELLKKDASFRAAQGPYQLSSYNTEGYGLSVDNQGSFYLGYGGVQLQFIYPGLTGQVGTVSIEIANQPGTYLRHSSFILRADKLADAGNQDLFKADATWWVREESYFKDTLTLESANFPNYFLRHQNYRLRISQFLDTDLFKQDASFKRLIPAIAPSTSLSKGPFRVQSLNYPKYKFGVSTATSEAPASITEGGRRFFIHQPGLTGANDTVSFEAVDWPGHYLRHRDSFLYVRVQGTEGFNETATFKIHTDLMNKGYLTFEAVDMPGYYIRHASYNLRVDRSDNSPLFKADSSFRFLEGPYLMQAENMQSYVLGVNGNNDGYMVNDNGLLVNFIHPGLTGEANTVSLESHNEPGSYMRHFDFNVDLENRMSSRNPISFDQESTYKLCKTDCFIPGYVTLEAANVPGRYLRHANYRVMMSTNDNSELFKHDSSFKFINTPSYIDSYNYPGYRMDISTPSNIQATITGQELLLVYPGLTNQPGTVSIEVVEDRGKYLRVTSDQKLAVSDGSGENQDIFRNQSTFFLRESTWFANTLVFESVHNPGSYITRLNFNFNLQSFQDDNSFKSSSSFVRSSRPPVGMVTDLDPSLMQSYNYPNYTFCFDFGSNNMYIHKGGKRFIIRSPGLNGQTNSISFLSSDRQDTYLRKNGSFLVRESRFNPENPVAYLDEATFVPQIDKWFTGFMGLESAAAAGAYIRHSGYRLYVSQNDNSDIFKADASFRRIEGPYLLQSLNYPQNKVGLSLSNEAAMSHSGHPWYFIHPGLSNDNGSISLESSVQRDSYLRHYNYLLDLENKDNPRNPGIFNLDASFYLRRAKFYNDYFALEPVNQANHFVRHSNDRVRTSISDNSELLKKDASFRAAQGPYVLSSYNMDGYGLSVDNQGLLYLGYGGVQVQLIYPGLTGDVGTVSLEIANQPGIYLRHSSYLLRADKVADTTNQNLFKADATWWLREELFFIDTLILESFNFPNYYIRHQNSRLMISQFLDTDLFRQDASFKRIVPEPAPSITLGKGPFRMQSFNYPKYKIGINTTTGEAPASITEGGRRFFVHQPGLTGVDGTMSFEAADWPGHYLRHRDFFLYVNVKATENFNEAATFKIHTDLMNKGYLTFESVDMPGYFIRHYNYQLKIDRSDNSPLFKADSSFRFLEGPYLMQSENMQSYVLGVNGNNEGYMVNDNGLLVNFISPGLTGEANTVSLESHNEPGSYMRHFNFNVDLEKRANSRNPVSFDQEATYKLCRSDCFMDGYISLEAVNFPGRYLRHSNYRVMMSANDNSKLFKRDASFKFINTPSYIESYNYPGYRIDTNNTDVQASTAGNELLLVYPGITNQPGTVSIESVHYRGAYLRVTSDKKLTLSDGYRDDQEIFRNESTFFLRDSPWFANTLAFESAATKGSYITRTNFTFQIQPYANLNSFKSSSSFVRSSRAPLGAVTDLEASLFQSNNFPNNTFGLTFGDQNVYIKTNGNRFTVRSPGLTGQAGTISFLSSDRPNTYIRQNGGNIVAESRYDPQNPTAFLAEATFLPRQDKWFTGYYGFESSTTPNNFIRHWGYRLYVGRNDNSDTFRKDASFRRIEGPYRLQSLNYPEDKIGLNPKNEGAMTHNGHPWYFIYPGLSNDNGSISLQSAVYRDSYLRHYNSLVDMEDKTNPRNPGIFNQDASFYVRCGKFYKHYFSLEAVNQPDFWIRHLDNRVTISKDDKSFSLANDASFRSAKGPYLFGSYNMRDYVLSMNQQGLFYIGNGGIELQFIYPGLTGQVGTVSVEIEAEPRYYIRHSSYQLRADELDDTDNEDLFRADATWWLREEQFFENTFTLESVNYPGYYLRHQDWRLVISQYKDEDLFKQDASFIRMPPKKTAPPPIEKGPYRVQSLNYPEYKFGVTAITDEAPATIMKGGRRFFMHQPGLTGDNNTVSFKAFDWPGHYLRHRNGFLFVDLKQGADGFEQTATFKLHIDLMIKGYYTFEAMDQPGFYIRHQNYKLKIDQSDNSPLFRADASFRFLEGPYLMQAENMKDYVLGVKENDDLDEEGYMVNNDGLLLNYVHPGLTGEPNTVSLESHKDPGFYMRHFDFKVDLEPQLNPRNPVTFEQEATFKLCRTDCFVPGHITLEAVNYPGRYLRHANYRVIMSTNDNTELFKRDSSFKFINPASYVDSYNYPGYRMDTSTPSEIKLTTMGHELVVVYPGLTKEPGSVSIQLVQDRAKYLCVSSQQKLAVSDGSGTNQNTFNKQATFFVRESPWFANTVAYESSATQGSFILRVDFGLRLRPFENVDGFKSSASFVTNTHLPITSVNDLGATLIQSYNYPNYTFGLRFNDQAAYIMTNGRRFIIRSPGLTGQADSISFLSPDRPDTFLRQYGGLLVAETRFNPRNPGAYIKESTFLLREDKWYPGYFAFEAATKSEFFIRHSGYRLMVSEYDESELFKKDASFRRIEGPFTLQSLNYPQNKLGLTSNNEAFMTPNGHPWYFIHPGLTKDNGSVSLESSEQRNSYLRHYNYLLDLENINNPRNSGIFKKDASFYLVNGNFYDHYITLEPVNMANHFVRHQNNRVKASRYEDSELFRQDASFRATQGPYLLESYNFQGYGLSVDNQGNFFIGRGGTRVQFIYPGLTGQAGTVSLEINGQPGTYLRHANYLLRANKLADSNDKELFKKDATWWLREEQFFEKTLNLESVNFPKYFLRHQNYQLKISQDDGTDLFKKDASFSRVEQLKPAGEFTTKGPYLLQLFSSPDKFINVAVKPNTNNERRGFMGANHGARFYIQTPGLTGRENTMSFLSADHPNTYLRHHSYILDMESLEGSRNPHIFDLDATFAYLYREDAPDQLLFESVNYPGYFISGFNNDLKLVKANGSSTLRDHASFRLAEGPYFLESLLHPNKRLKVSPWSRDKMQVTNAGERFYISTPGLSGVEGTMSLSQTNSPNTHICTSPDKVGPVKLIDRYSLSSTNKANTSKHCSFKVNKNINFAAERFFGLESSAYADHYLSLETHDSTNVIIKKSPSGGHIAMDEAGFRTIRGPLQLASYNQDDKSLSIGSPPARQVTLSVNGSNVVMVIPGLTGQPGTCSLQVAENRSMYLRHYGYLIDAEDRANPRNPGIFDKDASFYIKDDMWYEKTLALESVNYGSHYVHHDNLRVRITPADTDNEQYRKDASFIARDITIIDEVTSAPPTEASPLSNGAKAGVAIGTILICILFFILLLLSGRIAALCCRNRSILRKEGRYDTGDGFDNPIYGYEPQDFTLMYSPQGGVRMVDSNAANKAKADGVPIPQLNGYGHKDMVDGAQFPGIHSYSGYDDSNVYVEMGSLPRKSDAKPKKKAIPNPMYDSANQFPSLATQSSVELYVDDHATDAAEMDLAMADSGLPGMSNTDLMNDLKNHEPAPETIKAPELPSSPLQEAPLGLDFQPTPPLFLQPPTPDLGNDATDEYIAPTSPIFFGLRPPTSETSSPPVMKDNTANGFSSVELFASPQPEVLGEPSAGAAVIATSAAVDAGEKTSTKQDASSPATLVPTNDIDSDIPDMMAPPIPTIPPAEEGIYGEVTFSKKTSVKKKKDETKENENDKDEDEVPPPLPPRSYSQEMLKEYKEDEQQRINQQLQPPTEQQKVNIIFDDDPDAIYASIEVEPTYLTAAEVGILRQNSPPMVPPFPLDTPMGDVLPSYHSPTQEETPLPAAASLADISNGVLGPKGEIIPLPTRRNSKGSLLDRFSHVFSHEDGDGKGEGEKKKEKLPISLVNPLYDFEADYLASEAAQQPLDGAPTVADTTGPQQVKEEIEVYELDDEEREEEAYKNLVQQKTQEGHLK